METHNVILVKKLGKLKTDEEVIRTLSQEANEKKYSKAVLINSLKKINFFDGKDKDYIGAIYGIIDTGRIYDYNMRFYQASKGHGYAAEVMNDMYDKFLGKEAKIVGDDNAKNGADRLVDGVEIQTKFCASGRKCVNECFSKNGEFKYINSQGKPMKIEVPKDKYNEAVRVLEEKIKQGKISGVNDPSKAKGIIKESPFTYEQAKNVAKFGNIDSLKYDAIEGIKTAGMTMGVSSTIAFACSIYNGEDYDEALKCACETGIRVGGISWVSSIAAKQLGRTGIQTSLKPGTDYIVKKLGSKASAKLVNAVRTGKPIYGGAARNSLSKMLRGNIVTGIATTAILSSADVYRMFQGKASGTQVAKNITKTGASVAGGTAGWGAGATAGAALGSIVPGVGTLVGGFVGGLAGAFAGGSAGEKVASTILDDWLEIEDDMDEMIRIFNKEFEKLAFNYLITEKEAKKVTEILKSEINFPEEMREMYASSNRKNHANKFLVVIIEKIVTKRKKINIPSGEELIESLKSQYLKDEELPSNFCEISKNNFNIPNGELNIKRKNVSPMEKKIQEHLNKYRDINFKPTSNFNIGDEIINITFSKTKKDMKNKLKEGFAINIDSYNHNYLYFSRQSLEICLLRLKKSGKVSEMLRNFNEKSMLIKHDLFIGKEVDMKTADVLIDNYLVWTKEQKLEKERLEQEKLNKKRIETESRLNKEKELDSWLSM